MNTLYKLNPIGLADYSVQKFQRQALIFVRQQAFTCVAKGLSLGAGAILLNFLLGEVATIKPDNNIN